MIASLFKKILSPWVLFGGVGIAALLTAAAFLLLSAARPAPTVAAPPAAQFAITPAPTSTPPGQLPTPTETPQPDTPPAPPPGTLSLGAYVQIANTGGLGLNLRATPGLKAGVQYLGLDSEVFEVRDGPVEADGFQWWYLVGFSDNSRNGWAVANYLDLVQNP